MFSLISSLFGYLTLPTVLMVSLLSHRIVSPVPYRNVVIPSVSWRLNARIRLKVVHYTSIGLLFNDANSHMVCI